MKKVLFILLTPYWLVLEIICIITSLRNHISARAFYNQQRLERLWNGKQITDEELRWRLRNDSN